MGYARVKYMIIAHVFTIKPYFIWKLTLVQPPPDARLAAGQPLGKVKELLQPAAMSSATTIGFTPGTVSAMGIMTAYMDAESVLEMKSVITVMKMITTRTNTCGDRPLINGLTTF